MARHEDSTTLEIRRADGTRVPLRFLPRDSRVIVVAGSPTPQWAEEAGRTGQLWARLPNDRGWRMAVVREVLDPNEVLAIGDAFIARFGEPFWDLHYGRSPRVFSLSLSALPDSLPHPERVRGEFDALAAVYADQVAGQPFQVQLRERALELLERTFPSPTRLIEFGPGSGAQTLPMLKAGHSVLAVDPSPRMLAELTRRAQAEGVASRLTCRVGTAGGASELLSEFAASSFAGAYSMFGALSLDEDLGRAPEPLARALTSGSPFLAGILNRWAIATALELFVAGHARLAWDRLHSKLEVQGAVHRLSVRPTTEREFARLFADRFDSDGIIALSCLTPPFSSRRLERFWGPQGLERLSRLDRRLSRSPMLARVADQLVLILHRRP